MNLFKYVLKKFGLDFKQRLHFFLNFSNTYFTERLSTAAYD